MGDLTNSNTVVVKDSRSTTHRLANIRETRETCLFCLGNFELGGLIISEAPDDIPKVEILKSVHQFESERNGRNPV